MQWEAGPGVGAAPPPASLPSLASQSPRLPREVPINRVSHAFTDCIRDESFRGHGNRDYNSGSPPFLYDPERLGNKSTVHNTRLHKVRDGDRREAPCQLHEGG